MRGAVPSRKKEIEMTHSEMFFDQEEFGIGGSVCRWWTEQPDALLDAAAQKIAANGANPWVFAADARHFHQFAGAEDRAALLAMTPAERLALLGEWDAERGDWDAFSFEPHRQVRSDEEAAGIAAVAALGQ